MLKKVLLCLAVATSGALANAKDSGARIEVGTLLCDVGGSIGFVVKATDRSVNCKFLRNGGPTEYYKGKIENLGLSVGFTFGSAMEWLVFVGTDKRGDDNLLSGRYYGGELNASVIVGGGVNGVGSGFQNDSVTLQPVSIQQQLGANFNWAGIKMTLHKVRARTDRR